MSGTISTNPTEGKDNLTAALHYATHLGWPVLPLHTIVDGRCECGMSDCKSPGKHPRTKNGLKNATTDPAQIEQWAKQWPGANVGIVTGAQSGIVVLDVDGEKGAASLDNLIDEHGPLPRTPTAATGGGGTHYIFKHPGGKVPNSAGKIAPGLDVRGDGGYVVAEPSAHLSGNQYRWVVRPEDCPLAGVPDWLLVAMLAPKPKPAAASTPAPALPPKPAPSADRLTPYVRFVRAQVLDELSRAPERTRNNALNAAAFRLGQFVGAGLLARGEVEASLTERGLAIGLGASETAKTIQSGIGAGIKEPAEIPEPKPKPSTRRATTIATDAEQFKFTDLGNAQRLVHEHGERIRYDVARGCWRYWDGKRFCLDQTGYVERCAKQVARNFWTMAQNATDPTHQQEIAKHAIRAEKSGGIKSMVELGRTEPGVSITSAEMDADPFLFNVLNGTLDLRTGELRPHRQSDHLTKLAPVEYRPEMPTPLWDRFLLRIMDGNADMIDYLARIAGLCLTGDATQQELFIFHGGGANGKNVLLDTFMGLMGDYAGNAPASLLVVRPHDEHPTEIADLCGRRMVVASELEEGARLRVALVKRLTGDITIKARFMRQDFFEFTRTHKLIIVTNSRPLIRENTHAIWRRIRLVPFAVTIPEAERDPHLTQKLQAEWPGILAWAVRGCLAWQRDGMKPPQEVLMASESYQAEQDVLNDFLADRCVRGASTLRVTRNDLYLSYQSWAKQTGEPHPLDKTALFDRIRRVKGVAEMQWRPLGNSSPVRGFTGIGLLSTRAEVEHAV